MGHLPTVMALFGLRARYSMHGGATMPLPSTRMRGMVEVVVVSAALVGGRDSNVFPGS